MRAIRSISPAVRKSCASRKSSCRRPARARSGFASTRSESTSSTSTTAPVSIPRRRPVHARLRGRGRGGRGRPVRPGVQAWRPRRLRRLGGVYAEERNIEARFLFKLPQAISYDTGAAMMLKGLTAQYLVRQTYRVKEGDTILVHAAAGGVGLTVPMGQSARRNCDRLRRHGGKGGPRQESGRKAHDPLSRRGFRQAGGRDHQGREMRCGL